MFLVGIVHCYSACCLSPPVFTITAVPLLALHSSFFLFVPPMAHGWNVAPTAYLYIFFVQSGGELFGCFKYPRVQLAHLLCRDNSAYDIAIS